MKIRIIGPCGSGKSTVAKKLSQKYGIPYFEIDDVVWNREYINKRHTLNMRDSLLKQIVSKKSWIIEGSHSTWTKNTFEESDIIFFLTPHVLIRDIRIIKRFLLSRLGIVKWSYKQSIPNLVKMVVKWNHGFRIKEKLMATEIYETKRCQVKTEEEMISCINKRVFEKDGIWSI